MGNYQDYYRRQLENGLIYQDFCYGILATHAGIMTVGYASKAYQQSRGENKAGIEIKLDLNRASTGNLYIETAEKSDPGNAHYIPSGIYRDCKEYLIGDYDCIYRFAINTLRLLHGTKKYREIENRFRTSRGFLLPECEAPPWCIAIYPVNKRAIMQAATAQGVDAARLQMRNLLQELSRDPAQLEIVEMST